MSSGKIYIPLGLIIFVLALTIGLASNPQQRWIGHAAIAIISLLLIIGTAVIGAMMSRKLPKPPKVNLFRWHHFTSISFSVLVIGAFFFGLWVRLGHGEEILNLTADLPSIHGWVGLVTAVIAASQIISSFVIKRRAALKRLHLRQGYALVILVLALVSMGAILAIQGN
jgi:cytochrome b561